MPFLILHPIASPPFPFIRTRPGASESGDAALRPRTPREATAQAPAATKSPTDSTPRARRPRQALDDSRLPTVETVLEPGEVKADPQGCRQLTEQRTPTSMTNPAGSIAT